MNCKISRALILTNNGIVKKGIKFGVKTALHPLSIALTAAPHVYKLGKAKKFTYSTVRQFDKRGRKF